MARKKRSLKKKRAAKEAEFKKALKVVNHSIDCRCKSPYCISIRRERKEWRDKIKPMTDAIEAGMRPTGSDYAYRVKAAERVI